MGTDGLEPPTSRMYPLIYTSGERIRNGVEQAMMPITTCLPLPPVTWGSRTRCEPRRERRVGIVPPGDPTDQSGLL